MTPISINETSYPKRKLSDVDAPKATRAAWYALWVLAAVTLLRWVDQVVLVVGTEPMRKALSLSDVQIGVIQGLGITLCSALGAVPLAWLADKLDRRKVLAACIFVWSVATALRAYAMSFSDVMLSTMGMAIAEAALTPIAYSILPAVFRGRDLARANLILYGAGALGYSVAMMLVGGVFRALSAHQEVLPGFLKGMESWRSASFLVGAIGPLFCFMVLGMSKTTAGASPAAPDADKRLATLVVKRVELSDYLLDHWQAVAGVYGSVILAGFGLAPLTAWLAPAMARRFALDPAVTGAEIGSLFLLSTVLGMLVSGVLQRVLGARHGIMVPMLIAPVLSMVAAISLGAFGVASAKLAVYACVFVTMTALIAYNASMPTVNQKMIPGRFRSRVTAVSMAATMAAVSGGPVLVGYVADRLHSANGLIVAISAVSVPTMVLSAICLAWARPYVQRAIAFSDEVDEADARAVV